MSTQALVGNKAKALCHLIVLSGVLFSSSLG